MLRKECATKKFYFRNHHTTGFFPPIQKKRFHLDGHSTGVSHTGPKISPIFKKFNIHCTLLKGIKINLQHANDQKHLTQTIHDFTIFKRTSHFISPSSSFCFVKDNIWVTFPMSRQHPVEKQKSHYLNGYNNQSSLSRIFISINSTYSCLNKTLLEH